MTHFDDFVKKIERQAWMILGYEMSWPICKRVASMIISSNSAPNDGTFFNYGNFPSFLDEEIGVAAPGETHHRL